MSTDEPGALTVVTPRLELPLMGLALLDALAAGDLTAAQGRVGWTLGPELLAGDARDLFRLRHDQLAADPPRLPWSVRAIVLRAERRMVGWVNFHGPPGVNDIAVPGAAELGWTIFAAARRRGYATEAARALMVWAHDRFGVRRFISSTTPENAPSLRVHEKLGFVPTGEVVEGELIFRLDLQWPRS